SGAQSNALDVVRERVAGHVLAAGVDANASLVVGEEVGAHGVGGAALGEGARGEVLEMVARDGGRDGGAQGVEHAAAAAGARYDVVADGRVRGAGREVDGRHVAEVSAEAREGEAADRNVGRSDCHATLYYG